MESNRKPWVETPLIESKTLSRAAGCRIFLKLENLQPGTSFKSRGIGNLILRHIQQQQQQQSSSSPPDKNLHFYSSSGGNAGLAAVTASRLLGYSSTVVVPESTEESMILKLRSAGASEVLVHGSSWMFADRYLTDHVIPAAEAEGEKCVYLPPFDHPWVWEGNSSLVEELRRQMDGEKPDVVICSVGGGGLFAGVMHGLDQVGWSNSVTVLAVETHGADSLNYSLRQGRNTEIEGITSIAKSLGAVKVADRVFELASSRKNVVSVVLDDAEAAMGCWRFLDDERMLVEPACGVSLALAYDGRLKQYVENFGPETKVVIVVCGGSRVDLDTVWKWKQEYMVRAEELGVLHGEVRDVPSTVLQNGH